MKLLGWEPEQQEALLRALKSIATLDGGQALSRMDIGLIGGVQSHLLHSALELDGLAPIGPAEFAAAFPDLAHREQALQFLIVMPYADTAASAAKVAMVDAYADALQAHPETLVLLHEARDRHVMAMEFCIYRKLAPGMIKGDTVLDKFRTLKPVIEMQKYDHEAALKHERLGLLPEGTLGRSLWEFYRTRGFTFPGEGHMNMNEAFILIHDISHVLGGFNTTPAGEAGVAAFQGGNMKAHAWLFAVIGVLDFQLGLDAYTGPATVATGQLDPELFTRGLEMGMNMTVDLSAGWDPWAVMDRPIEELRREYNIVGAQDIHRTPPEGWWKEPPESWWNAAVAVAAQ